MTDDKGKKAKKPASTSGFTSIGDILLPGLVFPMTDPSQPEATPAKQGRAVVKKPARVSDKLAAAAAEIAAAPDKTEAAYLARELVQCTLPHRDPGNVNVWVRRNGNFSLVIQPGFDPKTLQSLGLPYGSIPRLLLLWIVSEAVRTGERNIKLGATLNEFLREIGLNPRTGGGKRSDAKRLKEQLLRLLQCRISFKYSEGDETKGSGAFLNMDLAREARYWWDFKTPDQASLFESELVLGEVFFEAITANPVPTDFRALRALKQSSFAIDLYIWTTYRVFRLQQRQQAEVSIPLTSLKEQFGTDYARFDNFKAALAETLHKIQEVFPALDYSIEKDALVLRDANARPAIKPRDKENAQKRLAAMQPYNQINEQTREWFAQLYPRHDIDAAIDDFNQWRTGQRIESAYTNAHFRAFVKKWAK